MEKERDRNVRLEVGEAWVGGRWGSVRARKIEGMCMLGKGLECNMGGGFKLVDGKWGFFFRL